MTMLGLEVSKAEDVFRNVIALYVTLIDNRAALRVRSTESSTNNSFFTVNPGGSVTVTQGQVKKLLEKGVTSKSPAEATDFIIDVETKAKRALSIKNYALFQYYSAAAAPQLIPLEAQLSLGSAWQKNNMDVDGPYASLYFRVKNEQDRERANGYVIGSAESEQFD
jgi:hypothetical protein